MRLPIWLTVITALAAAVVIGGIGLLLVQPPRPLISAASFTPEQISPNADGESDVTEIAYTITRSAEVTITFTGVDGRMFVFRQAQPRPANDYRVLFSGVVDGFVNPGEVFEGEIERRLMPDGDYTWTIRVVDPVNGEIAEATGILRITGGSTALPELVNLEVPPFITPNQDGISDRAQMSVYLTKPADLRLYLVGPDGQPVFVPEMRDRREPGDAGRHVFDYDGGIDLGAKPPPDGTYEVVAEAQDSEGQRIRLTSSITVQAGGDPQAEIAPQPNGLDVIFETQPFDERYFTDASQTGERLPEPSLSPDARFQTVVMPVGDLLIFRLTVENYGEVPIRTSGPWPGTVYQQDQIWGAMGVYEQSGAWRVGLNCSTSTVDFPWRWAIGSPEALEQTEDPVNGNVYYYLPAGERSVVWGAVRMTRLIEARNPQQCWAGLIHEDVEVSVRNARVGARDIELIEVNPAP